MIFCSRCSERKTPLLTLSAKALRVSHRFMMNITGRSAWQRLALNSVTLRKQINSRAAVLSGPFCSALWWVIRHVCAGQGAKTCILFGRTSMIFKPCLNNAAMLQSNQKRALSHADDSGEVHVTQLCGAGAALDYRKRRMTLPFTLSHASSQVSLAKCCATVRRAAMKRSSPCCRLLLVNNVPVRSNGRNIVARYPPSG